MVGWHAHERVGGARFRDAAFVAVPAQVAPDLQECFAADAQLLRNPSEPGLCRTQVVLRAPGTARYFLTDSIGNHHIILPGHHAGELSL